MGSQRRDKGKRLHRPEHAVIVEDNEHGIKAARASGAHVLVVKSPSEVTYDRVKAFIQSVENAQ